MASDDITTQVLIDIRDEIRDIRDDIRALRTETHERFERMELRFLTQTSEFKQAVLDHTQTLVDLRLTKPEREELRERVARCERDIEELKRKP